MKKILIIGASILQLPAILKAKEKGFFVGVVDLDPHAVGIRYADEFFNISTIDIEGIIDVAKKFKPNGIMTLATDMPMRAISAATTELNLPGINYEVAIRATDKGEMRRALEASNVNIPWYFILETVQQLNSIDIKYPCIIKPVDSSGSRGVILVNCKSELIDAFNYSKNWSKSGKVIVEEYMDGKEVSVEVLVVDGDINILAITDKLTTGKPHFVELGHSQPSHLSKLQIEEIEKTTKKAIRAIGIENGPAHVEIMVMDNIAKIIELGARMGGDCIASHLVKFSTGIDMVDATIDLLTGNTPNIDRKYDKGSAIRFIKSKCGTIKEIAGIDRAMEIEGVKSIELTKNIGDKITEIKSSTDRIGFIITQSDDYESAISLCNKAMEMINIRLNA